MPAYDLCVVIPTLNERENIALLLDRLQTLLAHLRYEVIVVDDDSTDGTATVVRNLSRTQDGVHVLHRMGRRGLASACIEGMLATSATYVAVMDADLQHDETILPEMYRCIRERNLDVVVGSRNISGGSMGEFSSWRVKLSRLGRKLSGVERHRELADPMSGFFIVRRSFFERIAHRLTGIGFKILLDIVLAAGNDVTIGEVPYHFRNRQHGESKLDIIVGLEYIELLLDKVVGDYISVRFMLFCLVGAVGVVIHLLFLGILLHATKLSFLESQAFATILVIAINYAMNNSLTYRDLRRRGAAFWTGMISFYIACSLGLWANIALSGEAFRHGTPWPLAAVMGLMFSAVWNFGITSVTTWRGTRRSRKLRAERRQRATNTLLDLDKVA
ncbi:MAG: glycosyltransferase [Janthinobacterium lividum]